MLVLGKYASPEERERLQRLRASAAPAPRPAPSFAMGMGPGGGGGRSDVSPSEGSALMVDNYGHLLPPKIDFDSYKESLREPPEIDRGPREEPDYDGFDGDQELTYDDVQERAAAAVEEYVRGGDDTAFDFTELSEVDRARVQDAAYDQLQDGIAQEHEAAAEHLVDNGIENPAAFVDALRTSGPDYGVQVGDKVYHLEGDNALVETQQDRSQIIYDANFVQERAQEIVQERAYSKQQEVSAPTPRLGQESKVDGASREQITNGFRDQVAQRLAKSQGAQPETEKPKLSPAQEAAQRIEAQRKTFTVDTQATPDVMPTKTSSAEKKPEPKADQSRQATTVQKQRGAAQAQPQKLSAPQEAAQRVEAARKEKAQQQAPAAQQRTTVVDQLRNAGPGHRAVDRRNGNTFHLEGKELVRLDKNGVETGRMDADKAKQIVLDRREQRAQAQSAQQPEKQAPKAPEQKSQPQAEKQSPKASEQKPGQQGAFARAAQQQSGGEGPAAAAAARAAKASEENAARRAAQQAIQKNNGQSLS